MDTNELKEKLARLDEQIDALPRGSISTKKVNGHTYYYHRWYESKTKKERFVPEEELEHLRAQIERRDAKGGYHRVYHDGSARLCAQGLHDSGAEVSQTRVL